MLRNENNFLLVMSHFILYAAHKNKWNEFMQQKRRNHFDTYCVIISFCIFIAYLLFLSRVECLVTVDSNVSPMRIQFSYLRIKICTQKCCPDDARGKNKKIKTFSILLSSLLVLHIFFQIEIEGWKSNRKKLYA